MYLGLMDLEFSKDFYGAKAKGSPKWVGRLQIYRHTAVLSTPEQYNVQVEGFIHTDK